MGMRVDLCTFMLACFGSALIPAQAAAQQASGYGYAFAGPAAVSNIGIRSVAVNAGGGGELWLGGGLSFGGELGVLTFPAVEQRTSCCGNSARSASGLLLSANASRHFGSSDGETKWRPFMTGGLSVVAGGGAIGLFNAGGGAERWISRHTGIRLEVRDQFILAANPSVLLGFRVGVVFR
jgi:hypothetical protein